ncbi:MobF family relaxase, partial [Nocardia sp. NPDC004582]
MMTIHPLHGGDGYEYLTRQVATADRERPRSQGLTDYYNEHGTPPGVWAGRGAEIMGVSGEVSEAQMRALYGEGLHPNADEKIAAAIAAGASAEEAISDAKLGSGLYQFAGGKSEITGIYERMKAEFIAAEQRSPTRDEWLELRTNAAREQLTGELSRRPTADEITKALSDEKRKGREAVVGWDCVFTPQKSVSILWGLGDDKLRRDIWRCHEEAVAEVLARMEDNYALARRGRGGKQLIDAEGLTFAKFQHFDNRTGDMNPHTHVVVSSRVLGSDGKWSSLRAEALIKATVSLSCEYNAALTGKLKRELGLRFEERSRGRGKEPVLEVVGVGDDMIQSFSRRPNILERTEELVRQYRQVHGRNPSKSVQFKLQQQATLDTREAKPLPLSLREMIHEWDERASAFLGDGRTGREFAADVVHLSHNPDAARPYEAARVAIGIGADLGGKVAVIGADDQELATAINRGLDWCTFASDTTRSDAATELAQLLSPGHDNHVLDEISTALEARRRAIYEPEAIASEVLDKVSGRRATWSEVHIRAAAEDRLSVCSFDTDAAHRAAVESIVVAVRDQRSVLLTVDPDEVPATLARRNGESVFNQPASTSVLYSSEAVLAAEARLQEAAQNPTAELVTRKAVASAIEAVEEESRPRTLGVRTGTARRLNPGQRRFVEHLCTSGARLAVAIGPAGAGKTTALRAVVRAWQNDGREVLALSPQKSAARVLSDEIGVPAETIDALLWAHRTGRADGIARGTMILVDEAGMASTANLHELQQLADRYGAVVRWVGDPHQLSAVESGGALRLIANDTAAPELDQVVRFANKDEATATLAVRSGDASQAWEFYDAAGRVHGGMVDELREQILAAHLSDTDEGKTSLMMAATTADVYALNGAAQVAHTLRGTVDRDGPTAELADGHRGRIGDVVVTRKNAKRLRITGGHRAGTTVDNGDLWRVDKIHADGSVSVVGARHRGRVNLPAKYVGEHLELGYASTVHRAQGMTVQRAHLLMNQTLGRALAYVGLSRAVEENHAYVATDAIPDPAWDRPPDEPPTERDVFLRIVAREDDNLTATEVMRAEQARINDPARLREMYDHCRELLGGARADYQLERALPVVLFAEVARSDGYEKLRQTLAVADAIGMDTGELIGDIVTNFGRDEGESLLTARDAGAALTFRADQRIGDHVAATMAAHACASEPETLAFTLDADAEVLTAAAEALNTGEESLATTSRGGRVRAVRDVVLPDVAPLPSRHPGADLALAEFAANLRARLLSNDEAALADARPQVPRTPEQKQAVLDTYTDAATTTARRAKLERDYTYYARELGRDRARWLIDTSMPVVLVHQVERGSAYNALLDTIALAEAHGLDSVQLVATITADQSDHNASLITARDAAAVLRSRADLWIGEHLEVPEPHRFRALKDLPPLAGLAPIPAEHRGMDVAMADYADELRRLMLDLPADAPDWRARAAERAAELAVDELEIDDIEATHDQAATEPEA